MKKTIEQFIEDLVLEIKENNTIAHQVLKKQNEIASCNFVARTTGVVSGTKVAEMVFKKMNSKINYTILKKDGEYVNRGDVISVITGPMHDILRVEKLALNFVRYMSGIASSVAKYNVELQGLDAKILYSGHAAPNLEVFAESAFVAGGGILNEEYKNTTLIDLNIATRFDSYQEAISKIKELDKNTKIILEVSDVADFEEAYLTNAPIIRVVTSKENVINSCSSLNQNKKVLELLSEIDLKKVRSTAKMGYSYLIIPSLSDASKSFPIDLCFYKRVKIKK